MGSPALRVEGIEKSYGQLEVLRGVGFEVGGGEAFGLLGANGSGKTTLNRIVVGLLQPDRGTVEIGGVSMGKEPVEARRNLAFLPETSSLYPELSANEILDFVAGLRGIADPAVVRRKASLLEHLGLAADADRALGSYSTGMQRKLALASCLISDAALLLLDEPTNGLDPPSITLFRDILKEWTSRGRSLMISSHILEFIEKTCHRVGIIHQGKLLAQGTLDELRTATGLPDADLERIYLEVTGQKSRAAGTLLDQLLGNEEAPETRKTSEP